MKIKKIFLLPLILIWYTTAHSMENTQDIGQTGDGRIKVTLENLKEVDKAITHQAYLQLSSEILKNPDGKTFEITNSDMYSRLIHSYHSNILKLGYHFGIPIALWGRAGLFEVTNKMMVMRYWEIAKKTYNFDEIGTFAPWLETKNFNTEEEAFKIHQNQKEETFDLLKGIIDLNEAKRTKGKNRNLIRKIDSRKLE